MADGVATSGAEVIEEGRAVDVLEKEPGGFSFKVTGRDGFTGGRGGEAIAYREAGRLAKSGDNRKR